MRRLVKISVFAVVLIGIGNLFLINNVSAMTSQDKLYKLSLIRGVKNCYGLYAKDSVTTENYSDYLSIFDTSGNFSKDGASDAWITTHVGNSQNSNSNKKDSDMSCKQVFEGYGGKMKGLADYYPNIKSANLETMGYELVGTVESEKSESERYSSDETAVITIGPSDITNGSENIDEGGSISVTGDGIECVGKRTESKRYILFGDTVYGWKDVNCNGNLSIDGRGGNIMTLSAEGGLSFNVSSGLSPDSIAYGGDLLGAAITSYKGKETSLSAAIANSNFNKDLATNLKNVLANSLKYDSPGVSFQYKASTKNNTAEQINQSYRPINGNKNDAANKMLSNLGVEDAEINYTWTADDRYALYYYYLQDVMKDYPDIHINECSDEKPSGWAFKNSPKQWCKIQIPNTAEGALGETYSIVSSNNLKEGTFKDVLEWLKNDKSYKNVSEGAYANAKVGKDGDLSVNGGDEEEGVCYANAGKLGWILCPIIESISNVGKWLWGEIETNFLQIRVGDLFQKEDSVQNVWGTFRDIANIVFIIFFLVVIFSQLTGVGIDNYGIKKILPKLIVVAILINLSYLLCLLAVDVSNILGVGLKDLFTSLAPEVQIEGATAGQYLAAAGLGVGVGGGILLFSILANPLSGIAVGATIAITVLGVVITIVVSILFMFLILMVRYAGIIILIAIAPVAIVCYLLPNTEKIFKRWLDLLKVLLLVYPICGALIGAGTLAGNLLASTGNETMVVVGMIVEVVPFFLIPMLLKQSLSLMGNIGAKLSSVGKATGKGLSSKTQGAIRNSDKFKNWSQYQQERSGERRAGRLMRRLSGRANLSERDQDRLRKAQDVVLARRKARQENEVRTHAGYADAMMYKQDRAVDAETRAIERLNDPTVRAAEAQSVAEEERLQQSKARTALMMNTTRGEGFDQLMARWDAAFDSGNTADLDALTNVINQRYGSQAASGIARSLNSKHDIANNVNYQASMRSLQQTMNDNASFAGNMKTKSPDAFQMIGDAGMRFDQTANGGAGGMVQEDMSYFTQHNQTATKVSDWANVSGDALQRGLDSGAITDRQLDELLTSNDPAIRSGIQSENGKREMLEAAKYNREHAVGPSGPQPAADNATASRRYRAERAENELYIQHENDAARAGRTNIHIEGRPMDRVQGYAVPAGFDTGGRGATYDATLGGHIYTDVNNGRRWNATTGRYVRPPKNPPGTP